MGNFQQPNAQSKIINRKKQKHKKSKLGCLNCRQRRIKCGEELDQCYNCQDRNLRCSFLDLSEQEKKHIIQQHKEGKKVSKSASILDNHDKELQSSLSQGNFYFNVEKLSLGNSSSPPSSPPAGSLRRKEKLGPAKGYFSKLDFNSSSNSNGGGSYNYSNDAIPASSISHDNWEHQFNSQMDGLSITPKTSPLSGHVYEPTIFPVIKVTKLRYQDMFSTYHLQLVCGEDDPRMGLFKNEMFFWYHDMSVEGKRSILAFHSAIARASFTILTEFSKPFLEIKHTEKQIDFVKKQGIFSKLVGLKLAQRTIERLNSQQQLSDITYYKIVKNIVYYSCLAFTLAFFAEDNLRTVPIFVDGFISTATVHQLVDRVSLIADKYPDKSSLEYDDILFTTKLLQWCGVFHSKNINSIFIPNYPLTIVQEFQDEVVDLISIISENNLPLNGKAFAELKDLRQLLGDIVLNNKDLLEKHNDSLICAYEPSEIFKVVKAYFSKHPCLVVFLEEKASSMNAVETLIYIFWYASGVVLDSFLPETLFLFSTKFSGIINYNGFSMQLIDSLFSKLASTFSTSTNPKAAEIHERLYRKTVYITRLVSWLKYRMTLYLRNLKIRNLYPDDPRFDQIRFKSRKIKSIKESAISTVRNTIIRYENYPVNDPNYVDPQDSGSLLRQWPTNKDNVMFCDRGFDINVNVDENYQLVQQQLALVSYQLDKLPIEYIKLNKFGLIKNVDYRPNLNNSAENYFGDSDFRSNEINLHNFLPDRAMILDLKIPRRQKLS